MSLGREITTNGAIDKLKIGFLVAFAVIAAGLWAVELVWAKPGRECEASGRWWDWRTRTCAVPVSIPAITGRRPGETREQASLRRNADLIRREREARARASDAQIAAAR
jgi:hypothetical protein